MPGGLLNIVSYGDLNVFLNGNPSISFFKCVYAKYTNFGLQKFRIDFDGLRKLRMKEESHFRFKIPRYADLLMDTFIVVTLPTIWSTIMPPQTSTANMWIPYEFRWIKNLGTQMIKEITISAGGHTLQKYSGQYLNCLIERDFSDNKKKLYHEMTGNIKELYDPTNAFGRVNQYPNCYYTDAPEGAEPSIRGRNLYIPINTWFSLNSKMALPLVSLQYNVLHIDVTFRPVYELFTIRDVTDAENGWPIVQPNFNNSSHQFYRFLQTPPDISLTESSYIDQRTDWDADIHLVSTYAFLDNNESKIFANNEQSYLIKNVYEHNFKNISGSHKVKLPTSGMVSNWMLYFQRTDVNLRNEWSNYTNWPYEYIPYQIIPADVSGQWALPGYPNTFGPGFNPPYEGIFSGLYVTGNYKVDNQKEILYTLGIEIDGKYREDVFDSSVYSYIEQYTKSKGYSNNGLYYYSFGLDTNPAKTQPSGAMNLSKFKNIYLEFNTYPPPLAPSVQFSTLCVPGTNLPIATQQTSWKIYDYNYDLIVFEEKYNILTFVGGNCGLMYAYG